MSYHIYTTKGIVLSLISKRETDKVAFIFTRDLGLIIGNARGVRTTRSKISPFLTELSLVKVSLVKGKRDWRVTSTSLIKNFGVELRGRPKAILSVGRILKLVHSMLHGEDKNIELYEELENGLMNLTENVLDTELEGFEVYTVAHILSHLGYLSKEEAPHDLESVVRSKGKFVSLVNSGIHASGLR